MVSHRPEKVSRILGPHQAIFLLGIVVLWLSTSCGSDAGGRIIPREEPPGYTEQPPYAGDCGTSPTGTVCLEFSDGYIWLISDTIGSRRTEIIQPSIVEYPVEIAVGAKASYYHIPETNYIRQVPQ